MSSINDIVKKLRENRILNEREDYTKKDRNELIQLAQSGDQLAVETLIKTHQDMIINYSKKYHLDTGDFDDIKQYVTIAFWESVMDWDMTGNFEAYAGMRIKRKMADVLRSEDTGKTKISTTAAELDAPAGTDDEGGEMSLGASIPSSSVSVEDTTIGREGYNEILKFMKEKFSETERQAVMMYIKGYKVSEIAEETGMKYKSVENALMRVKNKLADYLRARESKKLREDNSLFTDEEKRVLSKVFREIAVTESLKESSLSDRYEEFSTEEEFDKEIDEIEEELNELFSNISLTPPDERDEFLTRVEELIEELLVLEDYVLTEDEAKRCTELRLKAYKAEEIEYDKDDYLDDDEDSVHNRF